MSKNRKSYQRPTGPRRGRDRRLRIRAELRKTPDLQKIAGTVVALALAQAEKEAQEQAARAAERPSDTKGTR